MQHRVYLQYDNIVSPLGFTTADNFTHVLAGKSGLATTTIAGAQALQVCAGIVANGPLQNAFHHISSNPAYTRFEKLCILSMHQAISNSGVDSASPRTAVIISTTKGNIDMLYPNSYPSIPAERLYLASAAQAIAKYFSSNNQPVVISNACISGVMAIVTGMRMIKFGQYDHVIACGGDIINEFTASGFQSFKALSDEPSKPFDKDRTGLNLGEAFGTVVLSKTPADIEIFGGAASNDANHISGPSRDGSGLKIAINKALTDSGKSVMDIDFVSAHGTATPYNDEMEAIALDSLGLAEKPVNSLKGYFGHSLGGAGLVETIISTQTIRQGKIPATLGYHKHGVSRPISVVRETLSKPTNHVLKTASGFGGCNAALIFGKA